VGGRFLSKGRAKRASTNDISIPLFIFCLLSLLELLGLINIR